MEFKVRQESHSLLEKMFEAHSKSGAVSANSVPELLKEFNSEITVSPEELEVQVSDVGGTVEGGLSFDNFEKVMVHYLAKQSRKESNEFGYKNVITLADFDTP